MTHFYEPSVGHGLKHDPFNSIVAPRPIGWISSRGASGAINLAPYSFFNAFNYHPPIIGFASVGAKDTLRNAQESGEFTWNLATRALADQMNTTCTPAPYGQSEFDLAGLTQAPCRLVACPRVAESPASLSARCPTSTSSAATAANSHSPGSCSARSWGCISPNMLCTTASSTRSGSASSNAAAGPRLTQRYVRTLDLTWTGQHDGTSGSFINGSRFGSDDTYT